MLQKKKINNNREKNWRPKNSGLRTFLCLCVLFGQSIIFASLSFGQSENGFSLQVNNNRCVALRQGQTCYKTVTVEWQTPAADNYCIYQANQTDPVHCQAAQQTNFSVEFESASDVIYELRRAESDTVLATATIKVSWVYQPKKESTRGWRLF